MKLRDHHQPVAGEAVHDGDSLLGRQPLGQVPTCASRRGQRNALTYRDVGRCDLAGVHDEPRNGTEPLSGGHEHVEGLVIGNRCRAVERRRTATSDHHTRWQHPAHRGGATSAMGDLQSGIRVDVPEQWAPCPAAQLRSGEQALGNDTGAAKDAPLEARRPSWGNRHDDTLTGRGVRLQPLWITPDQVLNTKIRATSLFLLPTHDVRQQHPRSCADLGRIERGGRVGGFGVGGGGG